MADRRSYGSGSIQPRGKGRWRVQLDLGSDPATGKRRRRRFSVEGSKRDAQAALNDALAQRDHGAIVAPHKLTLAEWLRSWLERHRARADLADRTYIRYHGIIEHWLVPALGNARLVDLRPAHVADMYTEQLKSVKANTVRQHHVVLKKALDDAVRAGFLHSNPAAVVERPKVRPPVERRALDEEEIGQLLVAAGGTRLEVPIRLALASGVRQGELLALQWSDLDLEVGTLTVRRSASYVPGKGIVLGRTKTRNARRSLELSAATLSLLRQHRTDQRRRRLRAGPAWTDHDLVFPSNVGTPWTPRNLYRDYKKVVIASGIVTPANVDFHALRHTAATQWIRAGADIHVVSRRLGHASAAFTISVYGHLLRGMQKTAAEALDHLIG